MNGQTFLMEEQHKSRLPGYSLACTSGDWRAQQEPDHVEVVRPS